MWLAALFALIIAFINGTMKDRTGLQILGWLGWIAVAILCAYIGADV